MKFKKILIYTLLSLFIFIGGLYYWISSRKAAQNDAIAWIKENGGIIECQAHPWIEKLPKSLDFLKKFSGDSVVSVELSPLFFVDHEIHDPFSPDKGTGLENDVGTPFIKDISKLKEMTDLEELRLTSSQVSNIFPLKKLHKLAYLDLSNTNVIDISPIIHLKSLKSLNLRGTAVTNIIYLKKLKSLETLNLAQTDVSDISPLRHLKELKSLNLCAIPVRIEQINNLKKSLPNCTIHSNFSINIGEGDHIDNFLRKTIFRFNTNNQIDLFNLLGEETIGTSINSHAPLVYRTKEDLSNFSDFSLNIDLENITVGEIIQNICQLTHCKYKIKKHAIIIYHPSYLSNSERQQKNLNLSERKIPKVNYSKKPVNDYFDIIIPKVRFENRRPDFIVDFIKRVSRDLSSPQQSGLNIISKINSKKRINLSLDNVSVKEVIQQICEKLNLKIQTKDNLVLISD